MESLGNGYCSSPRSNILSDLAAKIKYPLVRGSAARIHN